MNKGKIAFAALAIGLLVSSLLVSCGGVSNKTIIRHQKMEEGVSSPTTVEELKDALTEYGAGDSAKLTISRQGTGSFGNDGFETGTLTVVFGNSNEANMAA